MSLPRSRFAAHAPVGGLCPVAIKNDHEHGMVQLMKRGATISKEFFTESERRQDFDDFDGFDASMVALGMARQEFGAGDGAVTYEIHPSDSARRQNARDCHL